MKVSLILCLLPLMACTHVQPVLEPTMVSVPIAVSCNPGVIAEPEWKVHALAANAVSIDKLKAVLSDLGESRFYIEELKAELAACS